MKVHFQTIEDKMRMRHNGEIKILESLSRLVPHAIAVAADTSDQQGARLQLT